MRSVIDLALWKEEYYVMFQSGVVEVYKEREEGEGEGLEKKRRLEGGEEVDAGGEWVKGGKEERLVFVSRKELLVV